MQAAERKALLTIALLAAFADEEQGERERTQIRRVAESLGSDGLDMAALMQDVLLRRTEAAAAAQALGSRQLRQLAFELALGVCDADGLRNERETCFLGELGRVLGLEPAEMAEPAATADALVTVPLADSGAVPPATSSPTASAPAPAGGAEAAELDAVILRYAMLNGALELLPQSMASLAIIALQMKLVHRIARAHGYELDRHQVKDLLGTLGVGLTGQYLEDIGRKLIGGALGGLAGRAAGAVAGGAAGMALSFVTTYALGQVARRYYASGRTLTVETLRATYASMASRATDLRAQLLPQMQAQARSLDLGKLVQTVRAS